MVKKAQQGVIGFIFVIIVIVILWFVWIGSWVRDIGQQAITDGSLTGVEAFFYANLNIAIFIGLILGILGFMYWVNST